MVTPTDDDDDDAAALPATVDDDDDEDTASWWASESQWKANSDCVEKAASRQTEQRY